MRLLLDTHVWLWMAISPSKLSGKTRRLLTDPRNELLLSAISPWEIAIKVASGRLRLPLPVEEYVARRLTTTRVTSLAIEWLHGVEAASLPLHHHDPFDRLLIAQSRLLSIPLVTADAAFEAYEVKLIEA